MEQAIQHGADVIIRDWVRLRAGERILIVSSQKYAVEVAAMQQAAQAVGSVADVLMLDDLHEQVGQYFDDREDAFDPYNAVIGADLVSHIIPEGNVNAGIVVYAIGMMLFTMIMGNAYAAITVMTVGIGYPFVLAHGANPVVIGMLALTCGFCGTLCTPMAANFNTVPVALLDMKKPMGVIKNQVPVAIIMMVVQIVMMILLK